MTVATTTAVHEDRLTTDAVSWASRMGIAPSAAAQAQLNVAGFGRLAALTAPDLEDELLVELSCWYTWFGLFDDVYCDAPPPGTGPSWLASKLALFSAIVDGRSDGGSDPFGAALVDLRTQTAARAVADQWYRFSESIRGYFLAMLWEAAHREADAAVSIDEYVYMRPHSGALSAWMVLLEIIRGRLLAGDDQRDRALQALRVHAANVICWQNDLISAKREEATGTTVYSLPRVVAVERGLPHAEAIESARAMYRRELVAYADALQLARESRSATIRSYAELLDDLVSGSAAWHDTTRRYR